MTSNAEALAPRREVGGGGFAVERLQRLMTLSLGAAGLALFGGVAATVPAQVGVLGLAGTFVAVVTLVVPCVCMVIVFSRARARTVRALCAVLAVGMLAAYAMVPFVTPGELQPAAVGLTWPAYLQVIAACAGVLAWSVRVAVGYLVVLQATVFTTAFLVSADPVSGNALTDQLQQLFFVLLFTSLAFALLRAGSLLDATIDRAVAESRAATTADVRRVARHRVEMLVHDSVIVALLAYGKGAGRESASRQATQALASIESVVAGDAGATPALVPREFAWQLQSIATQIDARVRFEYTVSGDLALPPDALAALAESFSEALRNSVRHASPSRAVARQVHATVASNSVRLVVIDDGDGFDPSAVASTRLGIRHGIVRRMAETPGGGSEIVSRPGWGTAVVLSWERPQ